MRPSSLHQVMASRRVGGAAQVAIDLAQAASRRGLRSVTWVPGPGPASEALARRGAPHRLISLEATDLSVLHRSTTCARLLASLAFRRRAVVHVHNTWMFGLVRPAVSLAGARSIVHFHLEPGDSEIAWVLKGAPAHIVTCARYIAKQVNAEVERQALSTKVTAVPNYVDLDRFSAGDRRATRLEFATPPDCFVVSILANLAPHKGQETAIRALGGLSRAGVPAELWIAGEDRSGGGSYERQLRELAASLNVTARVRFLGFRSDAPKLLQASDAFVLPSTHEGLPLSILEAQACGVPVVASDIPGVREIIDDGVTGFIVSADDPDGYSERLSAVYRDRALASTVADAGIQRVRQEHSWRTFEERMFDVYGEVAEN